MTSPASLPQIVAELFPAAVDDLIGLVAIPSVSRPLQDVPEVRASAERVAALIRAEGVEDVRILSVGAGAPAVVARVPAQPGAPTVLLYAHHDVQPVGNRDDWRSDPFAAVAREGRLYGRGAADDKAGVIAHIGALRALREHYGSVAGAGVGITLFIEGEEEVGSPTFTEFLSVHRDILQADVVVIADSSNRSVDTPSFTTTLRGLAECVVEVRTLAGEQHSGVYGGVVPDALTVLCRVLATLHDDNGDVAIPLHQAKAPTEEIPLDGLLREAGALPGVAAIGTGSVAERLWAKPAASVLAIDAPPVAQAANVLIPVARAKVSIRLAPGQDTSAAEHSLAEHLKANTPWGAQVRVTMGNGGEAVAIEPSGPHADVARDAFARAWDGTAPVSIGIGGSIPFIAEIASTYPDATILVVGPGDPASCWHGPNESVDLSVLKRLMLAEALLLDDLGGAARA